MAGIWILLSNNHNSIISNKTTTSCTSNNLFKIWAPCSKANLFSTPTITMHQSQTFMNTTNSSILGKITKWRNSRFWARIKWFLETNNRLLVAKRSMPRRDFHPSVKRSKLTPKSVLPGYHHRSLAWTFLVTEISSTTGVNNLTNKKYHLCIRVVKTECKST